MRLSKPSRAKLSTPSTSWALCLVLLAGSAPSCGSKASATCGANPAGYDPSVVASNFSTTINNQWLFFAPGSVNTYLQTAGNVVEQRVLPDTRTIMGVTTLTVHDFLTAPTGELLEDTYDYYAQDTAGNVWYFGEDTKAYSGTTVSTVGTWYAGEACAKPGVVMEANPQAGDSYRQEYLPGEAEDQAEVASLSETVTVPYGTFTNCIMTKEHTALAPGDIENKYYCPHIGLMRSHDIGTIDTGKSEDLTSVNGKTMP